jgi:tRNA pseudouridine38-40 synthase
VRTFKLTVAYDGTEFHGWQRQPGLRTVQRELEQALERLPLEHRSAVAGAGRTDAGVHARGQVASFSARTTLPVRAFVPAINRHLPEDVRIESAEECGAEFHARHSAIARRYEYRLLSREDVMWRRFAWFPRATPACDALERAVSVLAGEHDFSAFQATGSSPAEPVCRLVRVGWGAWERGVKLDIIADHFLYHMVRNIVGTALAAGASRDPAGTMREILRSRDRTRAGVTAPACGLSLEQVFYSGETRRDAES